MDDEEDIIFDQTTLLTRRIKKSSHHNRPGRCFRIFQTLLLCAAFFGLGLCIAIPGPTLLDLQARTQTNMSQITQVFTGRSVGYLVGSVVGGFLYDRFNQNCLLFFSLLLTAAGTAMAPWSHSFLLLMGFFALQGLSMGFLDTGGNVLCVTIWGRQSPPYLQGLHFAFGLGAFVAPLIAEPFLMPLSINGTNGSALPYSHISKLVDSDHGNAESSLKGSNSIGDADATNNKTQPSERRRRGDSDTTPPNPTVKPSPSKGRAPTSNQTSPINKIKKPSTHDNGLSADADGKALAHSLHVKSKTKVDPSGDVSTTIRATTAATTTTTTTTHPTMTLRPASTPAAKKPVLTPADGNTTQNHTKEYNASDQNITVTNGTNNAIGFPKFIKQMTTVQFAYLAIALYLGLVAICFLCVCCLRRQGLHAIRNEEVQSEYLIRKETRGFRVQILVLLFFFYFLYVGMEVTYGGLIMAFAVKYLNWTKAQGTLLTSVFWGSFALARGIAIFFGMCVSPALMLIADLVLTCLALAGLVMALESNHLILWFCTAVLGAGMASIFPAGITWAERYMHITGKATSVFVVGSALGEMTVPALTGYLFEAKGPMWLLYIMLGAGLFSAVLYIIMQNLASNKGERYEKLTHWLGSSSADSGGEEQELEMDVVDNIDSGSGSHQGESHSTICANGKKKVSFNLPKDLAPKNIASRYRPSFLRKNSEKAD